MLRATSDLGSQYLDSLKMLTRRYELIESRMLNTGSKATSLRGKFAMLQAIRYRIEDIVEGVDSEHKTRQTNLLPTWYLSAERVADANSYWRLASSIERVGKSLLFPVQILHTESEIQISRKVVKDEEASATAKTLLDPLMRCTAQCDEAVAKSLGLELTSRLIKLRSLHNPQGLLEAQRNDLFDLMGINAYEDTTEPQILFEECSRWLQENQA